MKNNRYFKYRNVKFEAVRYTGVTCGVICDLVDACDNGNIDCNKALNYLGITDDYWANNTDNPEVTYCFKVIESTNEKWLWKWIHKARSFLKSSYRSL